MKKLTLPLFLTLLAGCATSPQYDAHFGDAVREARMQMISHPHQESEADPGMNGPAARAAMQQYQDSFKAPPHVINVINIGGVSGGSGGSQ